MDRAVNHESLQTHFVKTTITTLVGAGLVVLLALVTFYYNTNNRIENHETRISDVSNKEAIIESKLSNIEINMGVNNVQTTNLDKRLSGVENKIDAVYNLLLTMKKSN